MPPEIVALLDKPHLLLMVIALGALFGIAAERLMSRVWRETRSGPRRPRWTPHPAPFRPRTYTPPPRRPEPKAPDAADQLRTVMTADFTLQPLLNKSEARLFRELDRAVIARNPGWQVMAQVFLGEVLKCDDAQAYGCINAKRVDLLLMDDQCLPRHAIEYQGHGHHQANAAARDGRPRHRRSGGWLRGHDT